MPDGNDRNLPPALKDRLIVALDVDEIGKARRIVEQLDGVVSFFKIGFWLAFARGIDPLIADLVDSGKRVFLDAKMYDIGQTVEEGVARAADRNISFLTIHGDPEIIRSAVRGKKNSSLKLLAVTVLTSLGDRELFDMGYRFTAEELVKLRVDQAVALGCDGVIASPFDNPDRLRQQAAAPKMLVACPGVRRAEDRANDHKRSATPEDAIASGADYLVVGRPIIATADPATAAKAFIADMERGEQRRKARSA